MAVSAVFAQPDIRTIIGRSVAATKADWRAAPQYSYTETDRGRGGSKTYEVFFIDGSPYQRMTAVNGEPLAAEEQKKEQEKFDKAIAERREESQEQRDKRIEEYNKERRRNHSMLLELTQAFDFKLIGEGTMDGRAVYIVRATPRKDYQPPDAEGKVLKGMQGRLWIDKETFQWVKVTARVIHPVAIEGFLARVEPGTYFELEKAPVDRNVWLPRHFEMKSRARVFGLWSRAGQEDDTFFNYRKDARQTPAD